ncbi:MAG: replication protein RepA [Acetobacteraceae bacterium]
MGDVHRLILQHGVVGARSQAASKVERQAVDAAAFIMAEEESRLGITHAGFAMTSLPHKRIEEGFWKREGHRTTLLVESGRDRKGDFIGVPYGSMARLILLYLQTEAVRSNTPEVELGRSMKSWMGRMNLTTGGKTYQLVAEQARRVSACRLTFFSDRENGTETRHNGAFVQDAISLTGLNTDDNQPSLWQDRVRLDPGFWRSLKEHPVPVREEAIKAIGTRSLAIDVYIWLAYRLHSLDKSTPISWPAIHSQFGAGFRLVRQIKPTFIEALQLSLAVYPEANVDIERERIILHPSPPAVPKAEARRLGII